MSNSNSFMIRVNAGLYLMSAVATSLQVIVFSSVGSAKRLSLFVALFIGMSIDALISSITFFALSNDTSFLKGTGNVDQEWTDCFYQFGGVFTTSTNMILGFICLNMWALIQFQNGSYQRNINWIHYTYIIVSFLVGMIDFVTYLFTCYKQVCLVEDPYFGNIISIFFVVFFGGLSVTIVLIKLFLNRIQCMNVMKQSNISPSLFYRMLGGLIVLIIIGAFSILNVFEPSDSSDLFNEITQFTIVSLTGFAVAVVLGTSQECLQLWCYWIKKYLGIDLAPRNKTISMNSVHFHKSASNTNH